MSDVQGSTPASESPQGPPTTSDPQETGTSELGPQETPRDSGAAPRRRRRAASRPAGPPAETRATEQPTTTTTTTTSGAASVTETRDTKPPRTRRRRAVTEQAGTEQAGTEQAGTEQVGAPAGVDELTQSSESAATGEHLSSTDADETDAGAGPRRRRAKTSATRATRSTKTTQARKAKRSGSAGSEPDASSPTSEEEASQQQAPGQQTPEQPTPGQPTPPEVVTDEPATTAEAAEPESAPPPRRRRGRPAAADPFAVPDIDLAAARDQVTGAEQPGPTQDEAGQDEADQDEADQDEADQDEAGQDDPGQQDASQQDAGQDEAGQDDAAVSDAAPDGSENDSDSDESDDETGGRRRRRRRGGRRRRRGSDATEETDSSEEPGDSSASTRGRRDARGHDQQANDEGDDRAKRDDQESAGQSDSDDAEEGDGRRRRRRRSRGRRSGEESDDGGRKRANDAVTGIDGSTRLEAKRQRRREGREAGRRRSPILSEAEFLARRESVTRTMIIRQGAEMSQLAVLEDGNLVEHYVDNSGARSLIGNVYLGKVQNVLPSMEAAFIDIGEGRNAVLYAGEVDWDAFGGQASSARKIESVLKSGQTVLVQVTKDPVGAKGARLTHHISLPGRYIVYSPGGHLSGISRKLPDTERKRLKQVLGAHLEDDASVIVRTAAEGASEDELVRDVNRLTLQWEAIRKQTKGSAPQQLYAEPDLTVRIVRDLFTEDFSELIVQGSGGADDVYDDVTGYVEHVAPHLADRIRRWDSDTGADTGPDAFAAHRIDEQIAKALERKVHLPSGGSLVIDRTEAMTVIDVNTGKFTGTGGNLEATVTSNNLEAAEEIVRQLRLRDLGGIIVIDFIDMVLPSNRELLLRRLVECLGRDRTRHQVAEVTSLGLVQMTRKRIGTGLGEAFTSDCEHCNGRGYVIHEEPVETTATDDQDRRGRGGSRGSGQRRRGRGGQANGNGHGASAGSGNGQDRPAPPVRQPLPKVMPPIPDQFRKDVGPRPEDADEPQIPAAGAQSDAVDEAGDSPVANDERGPETPGEAVSNVSVTAGETGGAADDSGGDESIAAAGSTSRGRGRGKGARRATRGTTTTAPAVDPTPTMTPSSDRDDAAPAAEGAAGVVPDQHPGSDQHPGTVVTLDPEPQ